VERPVWQFYENLVGTGTNQLTHRGPKELYELMAAALAMSDEERDFFTASNLAGVHQLGFNNNTSHKAAYNKLVIKMRMP
jgi:hypothetical protein